MALMHVLLLISSFSTHEAHLQDVPDEPYGSHAIAATHACNRQCKTSKHRIQRLSSMQCSDEQSCVAVDRTVGQVIVMTCPWESVTASGSWFVHQL
jgi:hypothetical protein